MNATLARIAAKAAAPAIGIGLLAGATGVFALAAPQASANPASGMTQTCTTSTGVGSVKAGAPTMMTRAGQIAASAPSAATAPVSCSGH